MNEDARLEFYSLCAVCLCPCVLYILNKSQYGKREKIKLGVLKVLLSDDVHIFILKVIPLLIIPL